MKRKILIIALIIIAIICIYCTNLKNKYITDQTEINYKIDEVLLTQEKIDNKIKKLSKDNKYTIDNPYVYKNPYEISPLTALIIFKTDESKEITVNINDEYNYKVESTKNHIIPIYGLKSNYKNIIKISDGNTTKKIQIKTKEALDINELNITTNKLSKDNNLYFMTSPMGTNASAYDNEGNLKWYLTNGYTMDFEWLENNHFLVGIKNASVGDRKIGFVEMDYLGKIYNYYILNNGYEFEFQVLENGNYMLCGGNNPVFYNHPLIYEIDSKTGKVVSSLDLYDVFKGIDKDFDETKLTFKIIRNAFSYNEETKEIVISLRGLNAVASINYETKKLNYLFAPDNIFSDKFDKYMVTLESGRYPLGIHSVFFTEEGYVGFINNGYDRFNGYEVGGIDLVSHYSDDYTSAEIYEIKDKTASLVWSYDADENYFSQMYGSFRIYGDNKLINFGWTLEDDYRYEDDATLSKSELSTDYAYAKIFEINEDDEIVLEASIDDGKYRIFKQEIIKDKIENFDYSHANYINTMEKSDVEKISNSKLEKDLKNAEEFKNDIKFTSYSIDTDYKFDNYDNVYLLLVGNNKSYKVLYKEEDNNPIKKLNIDIPNGDYALYLIINDVYYKTNIKVEY